MPTDELAAALQAAEHGTVPEQLAAVPTLVQHLGQDGVATGLLRLLRHPANLAPIHDAARELLAQGSDEALSLVAVAWHETETAEAWQQADCLADEVSAAAGEGVPPSRWATLAAQAGPPVREGALSVHEWLTHGMGIPR